MFDVGAVLSLVHFSLYYLIFVTTVYLNYIDMAEKTRN